MIMFQVNGILHIMVLKLMLHKLLLVEDLELDQIKYMKMIRILILYLKPNIVFVEKEFIVHLLLQKLNVMVKELRFKIKNIILHLCVELIHIKLEFVEVIRIIGLFLVIIYMIWRQRNMILKLDPIEFYWNLDIKN